MQPPNQLVNSLAAYTLSSSFFTFFQFNLTSQTFACENLAYQIGDESWSKCYQPNSSIMLYYQFSNFHIRHGRMYIVVITLIFFCYSQYHSIEFYTKINSMRILYALAEVRICQHYFITACYVYGPSHFILCSRQLLVKYFCTIPSPHKHRIVKGCIILL